MGMNMVRRLMQHDIEVVAYNRSADKVDQIRDEGAIPAYSLQELKEQLSPPRIVWSMLPAGDATQTVMRHLMELLDEGDTVVEGGNSYYKDDIANAEALQAKGIDYLDAGISGGIWGLEIGYCTMVGGPERAFRQLEPAIKALAPENGYLHCGPVGAGHFVKMVHNGIEYGMMQAYAEGFALVADSPYGDGIDFGDLSDLWNQGSVIRSWLLELAADAFKKSPRLEELEGYVEDSGEGRWTVLQSVETATPTPVLTMALMERFASRRPNDFQDRVLAALRREFGGHAVKTAGGK